MLCRGVPTWVTGGDRRGLVEHDLELGVPLGFVECDFWTLMLSLQGGRMGRRGYPPEFQRRVLDLVEAGRRVADVAADLDISEQTIYTWRRQDRIALWARNSSA